MKILTRLASAHAVLSRPCREALLAPAPRHSTLLGMAVCSDRAWQAAQSTARRRFLHVAQHSLSSLNAHFVAGLEFFGGMLLIVGLFSRPISLLFTGSMLVAYWTAEHQALVSIFSDPGKFYTADSYTFLFAALLILVFGPGLFSLDALIARKFHPYMHTRALGTSRWETDAVSG